VDILVRGRNVEVPDHFRQHVADKLHRIERYDHKIIRVDVELYHERNPRQAGSCQRVEITCKSRGPVMRAESCAADFYSALDGCVARLDGRLRRGADRRRVHRGSRTPTSVAFATGAAMAAANGDAGSEPATNGQHHHGAVGGLGTAVLDGTAATDHTRFPDNGFADDTYRDETVIEADYGPGRIVREKEHPAKPMTIEQALFEMELVGHDFFLFADSDSGQPSVIYRRKGYDYGVIRLVS
jgi:ribosomal subunit interface protein